MTHDTNLQPLDLRYTFRGRVVVNDHHRVGLIHRHDTPRIKVKFNPEPVARYNEGILQLALPGQLPLIGIVPYELDIDVSSELAPALSVGTEVGVVFDNLVLLGMAVVGVRVATPGEKFENEYDGALAAPQPKPA